MKRDRGGSELNNTVKVPVTLIMSFHLLSSVPPAIFQNDLLQYQPQIKRSFISRVSDEGRRNMEPPWMSLSLTRSRDTMSRGLDDVTYIPLPTLDYIIKTNRLQFNEIACYEERPLSYIWARQLPRYLPNDAGVQCDISIVLTESMKQTPCIFLYLCSLHELFLR